MLFAVTLVHRGFFPTVMAVVALVLRGILFGVF